MTLLSRTVIWPNASQKLKLVQRVLGIPSKLKILKVKESHVKLQWPSSQDQKVGVPLTLTSVKNCAMSWEEFFQGNESNLGKESINGSFR